MQDYNQFYSDMTDRLRTSRSKDFWSYATGHAVICSGKKDAKCLADFFGWVFPSGVPEYGRFFPRPGVGRKAQKQYYAAVKTNKGKFLGKEREWSVVVDASAEMYLKFLARLPHEPDTPDEFWSDKDQVLCPSAYKADCLARFFEALIPGSRCLTGYYNPESDLVDEQLGGYWYVRMV